VLCAVSYLELGALFALRLVLCSFWSLFYIYLSELFPTKIRSIALGVASQAGTIGSTMSPFFSQLPLAVAYFAGVSGISTGLCFFLKETKGREIRDDIYEEELARLKASDKLEDHFI
jgi:hypothetical protein